MERSVRYCLDCGWRICDAEHGDPSSLMIDHAIETGHDVDSDDGSENAMSGRPLFDRRRRSPYD